MKPEYPLVQTKLDSQSLRTGLQNHLSDMYVPDSKLHLEIYREGRDLIIEVSRLSNARPVNLTT